MKKPLMLASVLIPAAVLSIFIFRQDLFPHLVFFFSQDYATLTYAALALGFLSLFLVPRFRRYLKIPAYLIFLPIAIFPLIRCYFKIPYIFCRTCPAPCPWGLSRHVTVPSFVMLNLDKRAWCYGMCPLGTIQDATCGCGKKVCPPAWARYVRYLFLGLAAIGVLYLILTGARPLYRGTFDPWIWGILGAMVFFVLSFFIPRVWCNYACPVGTVGDIGLWIERRIAALRHKVNKRKR